MKVLWKTLALIAVCVVLGLWVMKNEQGDAPDREGNRTVVQLAGFKAEDDVKEITVTGNEGSFVLERVSAPKDAKAKAPDAKDKPKDTWKITAPLKSETDPTTVDSYVKTLLSAKATASYSAEQAKELKDADTGLAAPKGSVTLKGAGGKSAVLEFGDQNPKKDNYFGRVKGKASLLLFAQFYVDDSVLKKKVGDLRDKTLLALAANDVKTLTLAYPSGTIALTKSTKDGKDSWEMETGGKKMPADTNTIDNILASITAAKIDKFVESTPKSLATYGLDKPRITATLGTGTKGEFGLLLGSSISDVPANPNPQNPNEPPKAEEKVYVQRKGDTEVVQLIGTFYNTLLKTPQDLRDKTILAVNTPNVTAVTYTVGEKKVVLEKGSPANADAKTKAPVGDVSWQLKEPQALQADNKRVEKLLADLKGLQATGFIDEPSADPATYGFDKPRATVLLTEGGTKLPLLTIGKAADDGSGTYFKRADSPVVFKASGSVVSGMETNPNRLRDLLVAKLDRTKVQSIVLKAKDRDTVTLTAEGDNKWKVKSDPLAPAKDAKDAKDKKGEKDKPEAKDADTSKVAGLLTDLEDLRGDEWVTDKPGDLEPYGLKDPEATVIVTFNDKTKQTLFVGKDPKTGSFSAFVKADGKDVVFKNDDGTMLNRFARMASEFEPVPEQPMGGMPMGMGGPPPGGDDMGGPPPGAEGGGPPP